VIGRLKANSALKRAAAQIDDDIWVSGMLGDARLALGVFRREWEIDSKDWPTLRRALEWPQPRISLGQALLGTAHAAIDLSDGLAGDLQHIVQASNIAARVEIDRIPRSSILSGAPQAIQQRCMLSGGDDYELCFTAPQNARDAVEAIAKNLSLPLTRIGKIVRFPHTASPHMARIMWLDSQGKLLDNTFHGFDHFHAD
jgi:thiamine-monophosphate kinase